MGARWELVGRWQGRWQGKRPLAQQSRTACAASVCVWEGEGGRGGGRVTLGVV